MHMTQALLLHSAAKWACLPDSFAIYQVKKSNLQQFLRVLIRLIIQWFCIMSTIKALKQAIQSSKCPHVWTCKI